MHAICIDVLKDLFGVGSNGNNISLLNFMLTMLLWIYFNQNENNNNNNRKASIFFLP